jgi:hypothetical protein
LPTGVVKYSVASQRDRKKMFQNMPEVIINGPADHIEGRYHYASAQRWQSWR